MSYLRLGQPAPLSLVYEDEGVIAVNKPAGQLFHGYTHGQPSPLVDQVKEYIRLSRAKSAGIYLGVVHRLDRPVSGLSLFARHSKDATRLSAQFQTRSIDKIYLAIVEGRPALTAATLEELLQAPAGEEERGPQQCSLSYRVLATDDHRSLLAIRLGTGRRHQIRMQLAGQGWPIIGDLSYGAQTLIGGSEAIDPRFRPIALHAAVLLLEHPRSFAPLCLTAPLPFYWEACGFLNASEAFLQAAALSSDPFMA